MLCEIRHLCGGAVFINYPESLHRMSIELGEEPERVISWVYASNTGRQHRDVAYYGVKPDLKRVKQPYKNMDDKRIKELYKRTGGVAPMTGSTRTRSRTSPRRRPPTRVRCRSRSWSLSWASCPMGSGSSTRSAAAGRPCSPAGSAGYRQSVSTWISRIAR